MATTKAIPEIPKKKKYSTARSGEEKKIMAEDAAYTMKRFAELNREIREIKADPDLFGAARAILKQEIADTKKAMSSNRK